ncbi:MAG TPA: hypothetical protein VFB33_02265 [Candidatus Binataceae bacterium]|nr:hypothetical protein [Candidatus Binataceae bacterium]
MFNHSYRGADFELWNRGGTWFWSTIDRRGNRGSIGAAASKAEAVRDARRSIEEIPDFRAVPVVGWNGCLANLAYHLASLDRAAA